MWLGLSTVIISCLGRGAIEVLQERMDRLRTQLMSDEEEIQAAVSIYLYRLLLTENDRND